MYACLDCGYSCSVRDLSCPIDNVNCETIFFVWRTTLMSVEVAVGGTDGVVLIFTF